MIDTPNDISSDLKQTVKSLMVGRKKIVFYSLIMKLFRFESYEILAKFSLDRKIAGLCYKTLSHDHENMILSYKTLILLK